MERLGLVSLITLSRRLLLSDRCEPREMEETADICSEILARWPPCRELNWPRKLQWPCVPEDGPIGKLGGLDGRDLQGPMGGVSGNEE